MFHGATNQQTFPAYNRGCDGVDEYHEEDQRHAELVHERQASELVNQAAVGVEEEADQQAEDQQHVGQADHQQGGETVAADQP
jgi:hypothetical protein